MGNNLKTLIFTIALGLATAAAAEGAAGPPEPEPEQDLQGDPGLLTTPEEPSLGPAPRRWDEPNRKLMATAEGAVEVCETLAFPLTLIPGIGSVAAQIVEWGCLIPGALALDYVGAHHTGQESFLWQGIVAMVIAKLYRSAVVTLGIAAALVTTFGYVTAVTTALVLADAAYYIPVGLTGVLTFVGTILLVSRFVERTGSNLITLGLYHLFSDKLETPEEEAAAQARALYKPPLDPFARGYALMTAAAGAEPPGHWTHGIPVAGPLMRAPDKAEAVEEATLQVGRDVLGERPQYPDELALSATVFAYGEGALTAAGHAALVTGGVLFVAGSIVAALAYEERGDLVEYAIWAGGLGSAGVLIAATGVVAVLLRPVPRLGMNVFVPMAFGFCPPGEAEQE